MSFAVLDECMYTQDRQKQATAKYYKLLHQMKNLFSNFKYDFPASIIVFLVAMPLCLGVAMASGVPLFSGIIGGVVGGIVVTLISGSALGVSGPAAGLTAVVLSAIATLGSFEALLLAIVIAGIFQVILGFFDAGVIAYYFPTSVIKGMLTGIGLIIILKQIPFALGWEAPESFSFSTIAAHISPNACIIGLVSIAILIFWDSAFMKRFQITKFIQGPLVVVVLGVVFNLMFAKNEAFALASNHLVNLPIPETMDDFMGQFTWPDFSQIGNKDIYIIAFVLAAVASLESLLSVEATDQLDPQKRVTPTSRELYAQGIGNIVSGLIGGIPITQVIVRSSANIQSGARTKASSFFHGILMLCSALFIPNILNMIPLASLAAILIMIGFKLAKPSIFKEVYAVGKTHFLAFIITVVGILWADLLIGISMGLVTSIFFALRNNLKTPYNFKAKTYDENGMSVFHFDLAEHVSFLNKAAIKETLNKIPKRSKVVINARRTKTIHPDVIGIFEDYREQAKSVSITFELMKPASLELRDSVRMFRDTILQKKEQTAVVIP